MGMYSLTVLLSLRGGRWGSNGNELVLNLVIQSQFCINITIIVIIIVTDAVVVVTTTTTTITTNTIAIIKCSPDVILCG